MTALRAWRPSGGQAVLLGAAGLGIHAVVTISMLLHLVGSAYAFADGSAGPRIGSYDELALLGPAPGIAVLGMLTLAVSDFVVTAIVAAHPWRRRWVWLPGVVASVLAVVLVNLAILGFRHPEPVIGG